MLIRIADTCFCIQNYITLTMSHETNPVSGTRDNVKMGIKLKCDCLSRNNITVRFKLTQELFELHLLSYFPFHKTP